MMYMYMHHLYMCTSLDIATVHVYVCTVYASIKTWHNILHYNLYYAA